jgi:hypothetical protein
MSPVVSRANRKEPNHFSLADTTLRMSRAGTALVYIARWLRQSMKEKIGVILGMRAMAIFAGWA